MDGSFVIRVGPGEGAVGSSTAGSRVGRSGKDGFSEGMSEGIKDGNIDGTSDESGATTGDSDIGTRWIEGLLVGFRFGDELDAVTCNERLM